MQAKGFIFDFDGLILDTESPQFVIFRDEFAKYGVTFTYEDWWKVIGTGFGVYNPFDHLARLADDHHDSAYFRQMIDRQIAEALDQTQPFPGVVPFIQDARRMNIPMAVASSSDRDWVRRQLSRIGLLDFFSSVITADDVSQVKPDPELYLVAARSLKLQPVECIAFEDSLNGIKSAKAAGIYCIAIPNEITLEMPLEMADQIVRSFSELRIQELMELTINTNIV